MASTVFTGSILKFDPTSDLNPAEFQRAQFNYKPEVISLQIHGALAGSIQIEENSFIFGHRQPSATAPHPIISELQAGDTAILFFSPTGELRLRARLDVRQWEELAKYAQKLKSVATKTRTLPTTKRK